MKRVLVFSDPHCGHETGLTHPSYQYSFIREPIDSLERRHNKFRDIQEQVWNWYEQTVESVKPIDILFNLGDNIDGRGEASGSTELIVADQNKQCNMAVRAIEIIEADKIFFVINCFFI